MRKILLAEKTMSCDTLMTFKEKLETARLLDEIGVNIIEVCPVSNDKSDEILVKTIAGQTQNAIVSVPVTTDDPSRAYAAVSNALHPRLNVKLPVSVSQMEYISHKKSKVMLEYIKTAVANARALCADVEFTLLDATRAEDGFLVPAITAAVEAGADTVTVCDDEGTMLPGEMGAFISGLISDCPALAGRTLGVWASDRLYMAEACAFEAVRNGANLVYTRCGGKNGPSLRTVTDIMTLKGDDICFDADTTAIKRASDTIRGFVRARTTTTVNGAEVPTSGVPTQTLDASSGIKEVARAATLLGYELSQADIARVYEQFSVAAAKKAVAYKELDAIIASVAMEVPPTYMLSSYVVNSGNIISATAHIILDKNGEKVQGLSTGDGPIDAAFLAIEKIIGHHYELDDFSIRAVTSGREAMGEALVRLRDGGKLYSGRGLSTDIIGASVRAYLNALNKIVYRENV